MTYCALYLAVKLWVFRKWCFQPVSEPAQPFTGVNCIILLCYMGQELKSATFFSVFPSKYQETFFDQNPCGSYDHPRLKVPPPLLSTLQPSEVFSQATCEKTFFLADIWWLVGYLNGLASWGSLSFISGLLLFIRRI